MEKIENGKKHINPLFRRIQRITGYLTSPGRENKGKKAEIADRVKHISTKDFNKDEN